MSDLTDALARTTNERDGRAAAASDPFFSELVESLPKAWAHLPADSNGEEITLAFMRAAYGRGYVAALERPA